VADFGIKDKRKKKKENVDVGQQKSRDKGKR
jgi:hypothetical protein